MTVVEEPSEEVLEFACEGDRLLGILHLPPGSARASDVGVLIIVGGPQYRAGSHRQFVHLARSLASAGHAVLRFDLRGMGDSTGEPIGFEQRSADVSAALDAFAARVPALRGFALWGLCDGASAALLHVDERHDPRVRGLCLANPWVRSTGSHARTTLRHYYLRRILQPQFWLKLFRGQVAATALQELGTHVHNAKDPASQADGAPFHQRMLRGLSGFDGEVLLLLSGKDYTADEFRDRARDDSGWRRVLQRRSISRAEIPEADHTFSVPGTAQKAEAMTVRWIAGWSAKV